MPEPKGAENPSNPQHALWLQLVKGAAVVVASPIVLPVLGVVAVAKAIGGGISSDDGRITHKGGGFVGGDWGNHSK